MDIVICVRTEDLSHPVPGALPAPCHNCGKQVWRSPATLRLTGRVMYECIPCVAARLEVDPAEFALTDDTYAEAIQIFGLRTREEFRSLMTDEILRRRRVNRGK